MEEGTTTVVAAKPQPGKQETKHDQTQTDCKFHASLVREWFLARPSAERSEATLRDIAQHIARSYHGFSDDDAEAIVHELTPLVVVRET